MDYYSRWYSPTAPDHATSTFFADRNRFGVNNVLMIEHRYTNDHITGPLYTGNIPTGGDPISDTQSLLNYAAAWRGIRQIFNNHPEMALFVWAPSPFAQADIDGANQAMADNTRRFVNWLKDTG